MKILTILFSLLISSFSFAGIGKGHDHGHSHGGKTHSHEKTIKVDAQKAEELARNKVRVLAFQEKIESSWNDSKLGTAKLKKIKNKSEWVLTFKNEKGSKGKILYIFLKPTGEFIAANFTGK
jgi:hypothetical protein